MSRKYRDGMSGSIARRPLETKQVNNKKHKPMAENKALSRALLYGVSLYS